MYHIAAVVCKNITIIGINIKIVNQLINTRLINQLGEY